MALAEDRTKDIYKGLKYNFLFNNDINCIHILLNLYDLESNINNIYPRYVSMNYLRRNISKLLKDRKGNHLIAYNLGELIHEDVNRLELFMYIEAYKAGYLNNKETNGLENIAIKHYSIPELYNLKYLYHFNSSHKEIVEYKSKIMMDLEKEEEENEEIYCITRKYCQDIIRPKIMALNKYLDKQMTMAVDVKKLNIREDNSMLTLPELEEIYEEVFKVILKKGHEIYKEAYWNGLNDSLLKRYK